jgi:hypothetical protein
MATAMPERDVSKTNLESGAWLFGWILTGWAVLAAGMSLTDRTVLGGVLHDMDFPRWTLPTILVVLSTMLVFGHAVGAVRSIVLGDAAGALACWLASSIVGYAAIHGERTAQTAVNWATIGSCFVLHGYILSRRRI